MNNAVDMVRELGSTTKALLVQTLPIGEFAVGIWLAIGIITFIIIVIVVSTRSAL